MSTNPYDPPKEQLGIQSPPPQRPAFADRAWFLAGGYFFGALMTGLLVLFVETAPVHWLLILAGPVMSTLQGQAEAALVGWGGALMAIAHPINPTPPTACVTAVGLILWFVSAMMFLATVIEGF